MDIQFQNEFEMTWKRYNYFRNHPVTKKEKHRAIRNTIWKIAGLCLVCMGIISIIVNLFSVSDFDIPMVVSLIFLVAYWVFYIFFKSALDYSSDKDIKNTSDWVVKMTFEDFFTINDAGAIQAYSYSHFNNLTEDDCYYYLWHDENTIFHIPKDTFTVGAPDDFAEFIKGKISENNT